MKSLLLRLEPLIWLLFGQGILIGTILLTGWVLAVGLLVPLGIAPDGALENPIYILWNVFALLCVIGVGVRFFRLFPKAQPPRIGPLKPPPGPLIHAGLYAAWLAVTLLFSAILAGGLFA